MSAVTTFAPVDNIILYLGIAAVFEALAVYLLQFRKTPGAMMLVYCQLCKGIWIAAKVFCGMSPDLPTKLFWARFTEWMPLLLIYFWFEFIWEVSRPQEKFAAAVRYAIRGITAGLVLVIGFDSPLGWYYGPITLDGQLLTIAFGPAAWVTMVFCYALNLISLGLSVRWIYSTQGLRRQQAVVLAVTPLFNFIGHILSYTLNLQAVSPQIVGQLLSACYITWVFYRWRVYSILPLAQDAVTHDMIDGLVVVDEKGYIVDLNPAAQAILTGLPAVVGEPFQKVAAAWPALSGIGDGDRPETREASREYNTEHFFYQLRSLPLTTPQGNPLGKTILLKDITRQKQDEKKMLEAEKALSILTERERLGRELHDGHGQLWSYFQVQVEAVRSQLEKNNPVQAGMLLDKLANNMQGMHVDIRESITGLQLAGTAEQGIWQSLEEYLQWFKQNYEIAATLTISQEFIPGLLPPTTEVQLLRIIQEALTNIRKHANARQVSITITASGGRVDIEVVDDGSGFDMAAAMAKKGRFGLKIMQERADEIGATLRIKTKPKVGTWLSLQIPVTDGKEMVV
ncbi:MAG TPA: histidine kinase N-terminal 7TM domain-containing protein [Methylomusa anaerophila]|uniref:histidine kinase n=1 Tax=Methylomusa anaerophila TaxID=1930071 RepID=A0A348AH23_9FIRM|nr:histidine kinase N-terminal 7TM domain-containing protein [Methylomusa anaerophila]BBB90371.1 sensor histidine kinase LiaS [Methylomusa anaerophila]HML89282.1 histidine kinase N-terminal 7TM domain-containing protein [Methylomusa anaerophila]